MRRALQMALMYNNSGGASARRRRDSRGRYMEGDYGMRSEYGGMKNNYGARNEYDLYVMPQGRQMGFGEQDAYDVNDNDIRRRNTGREDGYFSEQGEHQRYPAAAYGGRQMRMSARNGGMEGRQMQHGGMREHGMPQGYMPPLTREKAEMWVEQMQGEGGKDGETWSFEEIEEIAKKNGIPMQEKKLVELYAVMNMLASDYYKVAEEFDVLEDDFFICMAKAFINDKDAVKDKVAAYYEYIVKKD